MLYTYTVYLSDKVPGGYAYSVFNSKGREVLKQPFKAGEDGLVGMTEAEATAEAIAYVAELSA